MRENIWLWWHEVRHNMLYKFSFKYRAALRLIDIQEEKIFWLETQLRTIGGNK